MQSAAGEYAKQWAELAAVVAEYDREVAALRRRYSHKVRRLHERACTAEAALRVGIDTSRHLFDDPKTVVSHGVRFGLRKGRGGLDWDDDAVVVARLRKALGEGASTYIKTVETPIKTSLQSLPAVTLKAIGVRILGSSDAPFIALVDGDVTTTVNGLLKEAASTEEA